MKLLTHLYEIAVEGPDATPHLQMGFAALPEAGSDAHVEILRRWLSDCDENHPSCSSARRFSLPTRVIDVGTGHSPAMKLYETQPDDNLRYIALSHPWGPSPHFCTFTHNLEEHKRRLELETLPATFKDAVKITRDLGIRYLWIDSICIIQGPDGDFSEQAKRMEDVFSQAYCVLAASSARGQGDGFLHARRKTYPIRYDGFGDKPTVYVSEFVDDFDRYVLQAPLNRRGWVLQERALAKRTIYFASEQTFWECGSGVQCETMTKMNK